MASTVAAVVVTYNRSSLLLKCIRAMAEQSRRPDRLIVVDNASTDGTAALIQDSGVLAFEGGELVQLPENTGGAGGFAAGMARALASGSAWIWIMDDDAEPHAEALQELLRIADDHLNVYGSLAVNDGYPAWATTILDSPSWLAATAAEVPDKARVESLPFLGFMIHRDLVARIGLPDAGYFIAADDVEYCLRARHSGADLFIAGRSQIEHPKSDGYQVRAFGQEITCLRLPPWKRYYDTRNRFLNGRKYFGARLLTQTIPGIFLRLGWALAREPRKLAQLWAATAGLVDGVLGLKGRRHSKWGISQ